MDWMYTYFNLTRVCIFFSLISGYVALFVRSESDMEKVSQGKLQDVPSWVGRDRPLKGMCRIWLLFLLKLIECD